MRPRVIVSNVASVDGRLTPAPGVNLLAGDERWAAMMGDLADPYAWARMTHDPQVFLEGSGSLLNPVDAPVQDAEPDPPEGEHFLPDHVVGVEGRRWFALVDGAVSFDVKGAGKRRTVFVKPV